MPTRDRQSGDSPEDSPSETPAPGRRPATRRAATTKSPRTKPASPPGTSQPPQGWPAPAGTKRVAPTATPAPAAAADPPPEWPAPAGTTYVAPKTAARPPAAAPVPGVSTPAAAAPAQAATSRLLDRRPQGRDGVPYQYNDGTAWLAAGFSRQSPAVLTALIFGWTGAWLVFWGAVFGVIIGLFVAVGFVTSTTIGHDLFNLGTGQAVTALSVLTGAVFGLAGGALAVLNLLILDRPYQAVVSVIAGAIIAVIIVVFQAAFERLGLRLRGYRRLSRDEVRRIAPLVKDIADASALPALPRFAMADLPIPNAWTHMRTIVLTKGLLQTLDDDELSGVLAHELHHWRMGDSVGLHAIAAAAWPIALTLTVGMAIAGQRPGKDGTPRPARFRSFFTFLGWFVAWPAWIITKFVIVPVTATEQRKYEYQADSAAARIGLGPALSAALAKLGAFEAGRTTWEQAMQATHPPVELRREALEPATDDDWQYQEEELRGPTWKEIGRLFVGLRHVGR